MFDPAALGTTLIGLETIRRKEEHYRRGVPVPPRRPRGRLHIRRRFGATLRRTADLIDPMPVPVR